MKKLRRREIWAAKNCIDGYLKNKIREMLEQEALARNGANYPGSVEGYAREMVLS